MTLRTAFPRHISTLAMLCGVVFVFQLLPSYAATVDPPGPPEELKVNPAKWTNKDGFTVSWENPKSASPINGAYYKLDAPPNRAKDGTFVALKSGAKTGKITGIEVDGPGDHKIYLWLQDKNGAVDHNNAAVGHLLFDDSPPSAPEDFSVSPLGWTNKNDFSFSWDSAASTDAAPIVGVYYKLGSEPKSLSDGKFVAVDSSEKSEVSAIQVQAIGETKVYVWLKDQAGNVTQYNRAAGAFKYDNVAPAAPVDLTVTPKGWIVDDSFALSWTSPSTGGLAPITGAYFKLDSLPDSATDGVYTSLGEPDPQEAIYGIEVGAPGDHPVYLWLSDSAGNAAQKNFAEGHMLYDPLDPGVTPPPPDQGDSPTTPQPAPGLQPQDGDSGPSAPGRGGNSPSPSTNPDFAQLTALGVSRKHFIIDNNSPQHGTVVGFTLSKPTVLQFTVVKNIPGRKFGDACLPVVRKVKSEARRCAIFRTVGSFNRDGKAGRNLFFFNGEVDGRRLKAGLYHFYVRPLEGGISGGPLLFSVRIIR